MDAAAVSTEVAVEVAETVGPDLVAAWARLAPQLAVAVPGAPEEVAEATLKEIVTSDATTMLLAKVDGVIVGTVTVAVFPLASGRRAWLEDLVVDEDARGRNVAEVLIMAAIRHAVARGAHDIDLASRMSRTEAQVLNRRAGFDLRPTAVYRLTPSARSAG